MGACGSSAAVVGQQKAKRPDDPTWTSLEDVLQEQRRVERRAKSHGRPQLSLEKRKVQRY